MDLLKLIPYGHDNGISLQDLVAITGLPERIVRLQIAKLREDHIILTLHDGNGYFQPTEDEEHLIKQFYRQETERSRSIEKSLESIRKWRRQT